MTEATGRERADIRPRYFALLIAPLSVLFGLDALLHAFGDGSIPPATLLPAEEMRIAELVGRYRYLAAFAFFGAVSLSVLTIFCLDVVANYSRRSAVYTVIAILVLAASGIVLATFESLLPWDTDTRQLLGRGFIERALGEGRSNLCAALECAGGAYLVFRSLAEPTNVLTSFAASAAFVGLVLSLAHSRLPHAPSLEAEAAGLRHGERVARRYLFCLGGLLTAGMTFLLAWMHWPAPLIAGEEERAAYLDLVAAVSLYIGVGYSILIVSGYLPVILVHTLRVQRFAQRLAATGREADETVAVPQLRYVDGLNQLLAVLSPILASAIGSFGQGVLFG